MKVLDKKYTMEEFKELLEQAEVEVLANPTEGLKGAENANPTDAIMLMMSGMIVISQLKKKLFGEK